MHYFMDKSLTVRRRRKEGSTTSAFSATATAYACNLQQVSPEKGQQFEGQIQNQYDIFVDDLGADVKVGDEIVVNGIRYNIKGKEDVDFGGNTFINLVGAKQDG